MHGIPEAKKDAVARALREAFGVAEVEESRALTAGLSPALVFRIVVGGCAYLLRVVTNTGDAAGPGRGDQTRHFAAMKMAAEAGIAPRVWYANAEDRVSITDFVEARALPAREAGGRLAATLRTLHGLPPLPLPRTVNYLDALDGFVRRFQASGILPESATGELLAGYARVASVYPRGESDMVSSHNDLKPENILFDGERVWLVDWEAAFLNDRYADLAVVANFAVTNDLEEADYLWTYFGEEAGEYRRARFYLMRQLLHVFYAAVFLLLGSGGKPVDPDVAAPDFRDIHDRIWDGEVSLAGAAARLEYARAHMCQALKNLREARFQDALRIVSDPPAAEVSASSAPPVS